MERRLAAILAADVAGYSRLMAVDETGTHTRLKALRKEFVEPKISEHRGRIVKLMGDGILVEFASAVGAVACGLDIQRGMVEHNRGEPEDRQIWLRVGINLGDILIDEDDIYGDGVNVAARLEGLAEQGEVWISDSVHSQIRGRIETTFESRGLQRLKNIAEPVVVWRWSPDEMDRPAPRTVVSVSEKPALVVLPFMSMSRDERMDAIADGFSEDLITAMSRIGALFVIARNTSFTYKDRQVDVKQVAGELGVRYVIEGSVRERPSTIRVNAQLIDATTGHHVWAEVYDWGAAAFEEDQDHIIRSIVASAQTQILLHEGETTPLPLRDGREADHHLNRGWNRVYQLTPEALLEAQHLAETALEEHPANDLAHRLLAAALFHRTYLGYSDDWSDSLDRAYAAAERAVELHEANEQSHWVLGMVLMAKRDHEAAVAELHRALEINPNFSLGYGSLGTVLAWGGRADEAIENNEVALRLNPRDPSNFFRFFVFGLAHFTAGRFAEAATWATRSLRAKRVFRLPYLVRVAALAHAGDIDAARSAAADMRAHVPEVTRAFVDCLPFIRACDHEALVAGLERADVLEAPAG